MRIVSLLPGTTEIVCALGLADHLVAVTHECDYPPEVKGLPVVTRSLLDETETASSSEIDTAVRERARNELSIYELDMELLSSLQPDIILTQALCDVCAVPLHQVEASLANPAIQVLSFEPVDLAGIFGSIKAIGRALGVAERAEHLVNELTARVERVDTGSAGNFTATGGLYRMARSGFRSWPLGARNGSNCRWSATPWHCGWAFATDHLD